MSAMTSDSFGSRPTLPLSRPRRHPHLIEINCMVWMEELSRREGKKITFSKIPREEWASLKAKGMDLVWLMGVWKRSADSKRIARSISGLVAEARSVLPDFEPDDITGSPYAVPRYSPDPALGTARELLQLKETLEEEGLFLLLDFVPNHTARDHPWVRQNPECYVQEPAPSRGECRDGFFRVGRTSEKRRCIANGRDPYFPPWTDTAQLNFKNDETIEVLLGQLAEIAPLCHGFRCDMSMLVLGRIFEQTWGSLVGKDSSAPEFWPLVVERLRTPGRRPVLLGEAYWGTEGEMVDRGFDFVYDKNFYDLIMEGDVSGLRRHLCTPLPLQEKLTRFLENHDEPRAAERLSNEKIRSAMIAHGTLPGMRFWQQGQWEGKRVKLPVQLRRGPEERPDGELLLFSEGLLGEVNHPVFHDGTWELCETYGWPDNQSHRNLLAWCWRLDEERRLIVVNFHSQPAQGVVRLPQNWPPRGETYLVRDPLKRESFEGSMDRVEADGLYVGLGKWDFHFFIFEKGQGNG